MKRYIHIFLVSLLFPAVGATAQIGVYGQFSAGKLNFPYSNWIYGPTLGVYFAQQHFKILSTGIDVRGSFLGNSGDTVWNSGLAGLRLGLKPHLLPIQLYVEGLIGGAHTEFGEGFSRTVTTNFEYQVLGGVDLTVLPHIDWRVVEFSYGELPNLNGGMDSKMLSTGVVVRLR